MITNITVKSNKTSLRMGKDVSVHGNIDRNDSKCNRTSWFKVCLYIVICMLIIEILVSLSVHKKTYNLLQRMRAVQSEASDMSRNLGLINRLLDESTPTTSVIHRNVSKLEFYFQQCDYLISSNISVENDTYFQNCSKLCPKKPPKLGK